MAERTRARVEIPRFGGMNANTDPHDLRPGEMQYQRNLQLLAPGKLQCRGGMRVVNFENATTASGEDVISMTTLIKPEANLIVYEDSAGNVRVGRNPL